MSPFSLLVAEATSRTYYEWVRLHSLNQWWHWMALAVVVAGVCSLVGYLYYLDSRELPRGTRWTLAILRLLAFAALLVFFLDLEKKSEQKVVKNSRASVLIDTSQSMGLSDGDSTSMPAGPSRLSLVVAELTSGDLLRDLRQDHDVVVHRFDQTAAPVEIASFQKIAVRDNSTTDANTNLLSASSLREARWLMGIAAALLLLAALAVIAHFLLGAAVRSSEGQSWALLVSVVVTVVAVVTIAVCNLRNPAVAPAVAFGLRAPQPVNDPTGMSPAATQDDSPTVDWQAALAPRGVETRLGDAIRSIVEKERGGPLAGVVVLTDGRSNAGLEYTGAARLAREAGVPIFPVGLGSDRRPVNVRIVDLEAPPRVYPGDSFSMTGFVQSYGLAGRTVKVELFSAADEGPDKSGEQRFEEQRLVQLAGEGDVLPVTFEITPEEKGRRVYRLRVVPPPEDHDALDNEKTARVQIVERKNRVLLLAGGPTREYRFVRNLLYRDRETVVDVLLQNAQAGISQEADDILREFPSDADELFQYDCIIAFDPDWRELDLQQAQLLDRWVAEKAGGLIVIAGPVYTKLWAERRAADPVTDIIKGLYPVVFYGRLSGSFQLGRTSSATAWPLQLTEEGLQSQFLWLADSALASEQAWVGFDGVYSYYAVKDAKPGAKVYARFSDPQTAIDGDLPIYLAGQFYGAGRVLYIGSGEFWRLRAGDDTQFEQIYTRLIRQASQGRLMRDSSRGVLLVGTQRCVLGEHVSVRASLTDAQHRPLDAADVQAILVQPDSIRQTLVLSRVKDAVREGMFAGQFVALQEGDYRIELKVPDSDDDEFLTSEVRVRVPELEIEQPQRNDVLLSDLARQTLGTYYVGLDAAVGRRGVPPLTSRVAPKDQETYLPAVPDKQFDRRLMTWLLIFICGVLSLEWLFRRLNKLA